MSRYRLVVREEAEQDILDAAAWYEEQRLELGLQFLDTVEGGLNRVQDYPFLYQLIEGEVRRVVLDRFPYAIFFRVRADDVVEVLAVLHCARSPRRWQGRL